MAAVPALQEPAGLHPAVALGMPALGTHEPLGPTPPEQRLGALRLRAVALQELTHAQTLLTLHRILGHVIACAWLPRRQGAPIGGSIREPAELCW
jgi:hypothetical protein